MDIKELLETEPDRIKASVGWLTSITSSMSIMGCIMSIAIILDGDVGNVKVFISHLLDQVYEKEKEEYKIFGDDVSKEEFEKQKNMILEYIDQNRKLIEVCKK